MTGLPHVAVADIGPLTSVSVVLLTNHNIEGEFLRAFPHAASPLAEGDATDAPATRVEWVFRHAVMPAAMGHEDALRDVFDWIERLLQSTDPLIEYWTVVRLLGRTLDRAEWVSVVEEHAGPLLTKAMATLRET